jgi:hypothetical protein
LGVYDPARSFFDLVGAILVLNKFIFLLIISVLQFYEIKEIAFGKI